MPRDSEQTRQLIIDKALPIFNTKGYNAASISDITNATGITKGAIYGNFKNKDEVATAAFEKGVQIVTGKMASRISAEKTAPAKLMSIINYYEDYIQKPPIAGGCPVLNSSIEADDSLPFLRSRVIRSIDLMKSSIAKIVTRGVLEGQISKNVDAEEFSNFFFAILEGGISLSRVEGDLRSFSYVKNFVKRQIELISI